MDNHSPNRSALSKFQKKLNRNRKCSYMVNYSCESSYIQSMIVKEANRMIYLKLCEEMRPLTVAPAMSFGEEDWQSQKSATGYLGSSELVRMCGFLRESESHWN